MAKRATITEPTFDALVDEFRDLVGSMEDVFSAAAGSSGEKLTELKIARSAKAAAVSGASAKISKEPSTLPSIVTPL